MQIMTKIVLSPEDIISYQQGETAASIAKKRNISPMSVARYLKAAGIEIKGRGVNQYSNPYSASQQDINSYQNGESAASIARKNNSSASAVVRKLKAIKIITRTRKRCQDNYIDEHS
jgi:hypothetical protein